MGVLKPPSRVPITQYAIDSEDKGMTEPLRNAIEISEWDMHHPCKFCGSPDCDPDEMDLWVSHMVTWHGYKVVQDVPGSLNGEKPRIIRLELVGWSEHAHFAANQRVTVRAGAQQRDLVGRHATVVGYNPSTAEYAVTFGERPPYAILDPRDLDPYVSAR
jgi:hypothetical protein